MAGNKKHNENFLEWLNSLPRPTQNNVAAKMKTSTGQLRQIAYGNRPCSVRLAIEIDKFSGGKVSMVEMAKDVDWDHVKLFIHAR